MRRPRATALVSATDPPRGRTHSPPPWWAPGTDPAPPRPRHVPLLRRVPRRGPALQFLSQTSPESTLDVTHPQAPGHGGVRRTRSRPRAGPLGHDRVDDADPGRPDPDRGPEGPVAVLLEHELAGHLDAAVGRRVHPAARPPGRHARKATRTPVRAGSDRRRVCAGSHHQLVRAAARRPRDAGSFDGDLPARAVGAARRTARAAAAGGDGAGQRNPGVRQRSRPGRRGAAHPGRAPGLPPGVLAGDRTVPDRAGHRGDRRPAVTLLHRRTYGLAGSDDTHAARWSCSCCPSLRAVHGVGPRRAAWGCWEARRY